MAKPLVYQITNTVSEQLQADCVALLGGVSIMSPQPREAAEIAASCDALLINIGTPPDCAKELYLAAARAAAAHARPIVVDAVGYGFSRFRTEAADALLSEIKFSVIKGNFAEIAALCGRAISPRGVSSELAEDGAASVVKQCAKKFRAVVYCTGGRDFISDGERGDVVSGGSPMLSLTSGVGCALGSATALFCASEEPYSASLRALKLFRRAAEDVAHCGAAGPYSFRAAFMDRLAQLNSEEEKNVR